MRIYLSAAFVMILSMGWGAYVKATYISPGTQTDSSMPGFAEENEDLSSFIQNPSPSEDGTVGNSAINSGTAAGKIDLARNEVPKQPSTSAPISAPVPTRLPTKSSEITGITIDSAGATVTLVGVPSGVRYSTDSVSNESITLINGRHFVSWPQDTTFACYQAKGSNGIWTSIHCNTITPGVKAPIVIAALIPTGTPTPTSTLTPTPTPPTPTPTPTPPPSSCGSGGACSTSQIAPHDTRANCWVYLRSPYNKTYDITSYVANGNDHPGGDVIVPYCGTDIYDVFIGKAGGHRHSNSAINSILQAYYIGPFQP